MSLSPGSTAARRLLPVWFPWVLVAALVGWFAYGTWPAVPLEGDEQGVLFGLAGRQQGDAVLAASRYLYGVQSGSYHLLFMLTRILPGSNEVVFAAASAAGALAFAVAGARLLQLLLDRPFAWMLAGMLWCQEISAGGFYMNTSALAAGLATTALILAGSQHRFAWAGAGLLVAVAGWLRIDSLLLAPACLGIAHWRLRAWPAALARTTAIALSSLAVLSLLLALEHFTLLRAAGTFGQRAYWISSVRTFAEVTFNLLSPALGLAALLGLVLLAWRRQSALLFVLLCGAGPSLLSYGGSLTSPKYFYYLVPFALLPAIHLLDTLLARVREAGVPGRALLLAGLAAVFAADGLVGLRTLTPEQRLFTVAPTWATLGQVPWAGKTLSLVLGPGELIGTADGFRVRTGQLFAPWCWHHEKRHMRVQLQTIRSWLADPRELTLYWSSWLPYQVVARELYAAGFRPLESRMSGDGVTYPGRWQRGNQAAHADFLGYVGSPYQPPGPVPAPTGVAYFVGDWAHQPITELDDGGRWQVVSPPVEGFISLHRREQP